jgi:AmmeMemoRadiSam system protein B/AmmeMemoRadiSam system protein A
MASVRPPAIAGTFYPSRPAELDAAVQFYLSQVEGMAAVPKAIIAPHAGFIYSGPVAATAYARIRPARDRIRRVVLIGPCHRVAVEGVALPTVDAFRTPLGDVPLDKGSIEKVLDLPFARKLDEAHAKEHSLEVHLPFLQKILSNFSLVPIAAGRATAEQMSQLLDMLWGGPETLIVISSDLSHYHSYDEAKQLDAESCAAIEALDSKPLDGEHACGRVPVSGLLALAKKKGLTAKTVDMRNSGDTAGPRDRVVGYGSWVFDETESSEGSEEAERCDAILRAHGEKLLRLAASSIENGIINGEPAPVDLLDWPAVCREHGASFITLKRSGNLRGCIGTPIAHQPLATDVSQNAYKAAFKDRRFRPLDRGEVSDIALSVSLLTRPEPLAFEDEEDLLRKIVPGEDGLILSDGPKRGLFLPMVWESLPDPRAFLTNLKRKAGLPENHWSLNVKIERFLARQLKDTDLDEPYAIWNRDVRFGL